MNTIHKTRPDGLLPKERLFVSHYLRCLNGTQAALAAGYSQASAHVQATYILRRPEVKAAVREGFREMAPEPEEIITRLSNIARADMSELLDIDEGGYPRFNFKKAKEWGKMGLIKRLKFDRETGLPDVELHDSMAAMAHLAKIMGMMIDKQMIDVNHHGNVDVNVVRDSMSTLMANPATLKVAMELASKLANGGVNKQLPAPIVATSDQVQAMPAAQESPLPKNEKTP